MGDIKFVHTTKNHGKLTEIQNIVFELIQLLVTADNLFFICMFTFFNYDVDPLLSNLPQA